MHQNNVSIPLRLSQARLALALAAASLGLPACKTLVPYDSHFMCEKSQDYGQCMDVQAAYQDALGAEQSLQEKQPPNKKDRTWRYQGGSPGSPTGVLRPIEPSKNPKAVKAAYIPPNGADLYRELAYRELAGLIEKPVTPIVKPPKVLRTLIVPYTAADSLYMSRYIYYFAEESKFVLGDYLTPVDETRTVYPHGGSTAKRE